MEPKFKISSVVKTSWKITFTQIWVLVGLAIGYTILSGILSVFSSPAQGYTAGVIIINIINILIGCIFTLGYTKNMFQTLDGEEPQFSAYGSQSRKLFTYLVANIIYAVIVVIGTILLIIPGIYLALRLQFYTALIVEEDAGIIESLKRSWEITRGQTWRLFLLSLVQIGFFLGGLILLLVGLFVAIPVVLMTYCETYRKLIAPQNTEETVFETIEN